MSPEMTVWRNVIEVYDLSRPGEREVRNLALVRSWCCHLSTMALRQQQTSSIHCQLTRARGGASIVQ